MALDEVNTKIAQVALDNCEGFPFEQFANELIAALDGPGFIPVGGTSDGGADGARVEGLYTKDKPNVFYQMSVTANHRPKIKQTLDRLEEFGRTVKTIIYVTSQTIGTFDKEEEELTEKHDVFVRIRDAKWLISKINYNEATKRAYYTHLHRFTDFLNDLSKGNQLKLSDNITHPSVYVFLQLQVENREKDKHLVKTVADSLILWALNDTDPDNGKFMTQKEINQKIIDNIPWAKSIVGGMLSDRLRELVKKNGVGGKQVNYHKKGDKYCLPYETRTIIAQEKAIDEGVKIDVISEISSQEILSHLDIDERNTIANLAIRTSQLFFEKEGLKCSSYLNGSDGNEITFIENTVFDRVSDALDEYEKEEGRNYHSQKDLVVNVVRSMFYQSTQNQRALLNKFSRTYVLLFTLQAEPRVVEYFQKATANFRLIVGTDMIVRALVNADLKLTHFTALSPI
ncbi:hypothetical protein RJD38_08565 [Vibrio scophthalmi]|uniref:hypothetical protein n=1 Tax=Vibrio scophthalmi TaxID=45658 RepID=UPI00349F8766